MSCRWPPGRRVTAPYLQKHSPVAPSGQYLTYGHIRMNCDVVVSGGLGCSIVPFRLGVPPEIVQVTLGKPGFILS
jgi:predicted MPP superfamily phosphohydrolase